MILHKIFKIAALLLGVVALVLGVWLFMSGEGENHHLIAPLMTIAYVVLAAIIFLVLVFVIIGLFKGNIVKTLVTVGAFALVVFIGYLFASGVETPMRDGEVLSEGSSRLVGTGLYTFYFLAIIAIGTMVVTGAKKIFK